MMSEIIDYLQQHITDSLLVGIVLGSGLEELSYSLKDRVVVQYADIPSFIDTSVDGHAGEFIIGKIKQNENQNNVNFFVDFSQLRYVKVSFYIEEKN